ncbi:MAG: hypothetical protein GY708_10615 [Actinomycetia bacterium]|nr:hypothetical protein [Actinomycetes bacterium]MCP4959180.1 hypothetical protein [Actinomycetes bacterium]
MTSTPYVILTTQRAGSVFLQESLSSHPEVHCDGEVLLGLDGFDAHPAPDRLERSRLVSHGWSFVAGGGLLAPNRRLGRLYSSGLAPVIGCRVMYNQVQARTLRWVRRNDVRVVHLSRGNLLRQYVSLVAMHRRVRESGRGVAHSRDGRRVAAVEIDLDRATRFMRRRQRSVARFASFTRQAGGLELQFERLIVDGALAPDVQQELAHFLGISADFGTSSLTPTGAALLVDSIANYDEIAASLTGSEFGGFLDDAS